MIIAVDFDGTIVKHEYPAIGKVMPFAFETLQTFRAQGDKLILWTCREGKELKAAVEFCKEYGLEFDAVNENLPDYGLDNNCRKVFAHWYIDDKANDEYINWKHLEMIRPVAENKAVQIVSTCNS